MNKLSAYGVCHARAAISSLGRIVRAPFASFLTIAVIAIALAIPATLYLLLNNIQIVGQRWNTNSTQVSLYLKQNLAQSTTQDLLHQLRANPEIANVRYISPDDGLVEFSQVLASQNVIKILQHNPLPGVILVQPVLSLQNSVALSQLVDSFKQLPEVELAQVDMQWLARLQNITDLIKNIVSGLAIILGCGVLLIVGNTIRLTTQSERKEIAIFKLVGATNAFIRRPFLYAGIWYGLLGAIGSIVIVNVFLNFVQAPIAKLASSYGSDFSLSGMNEHMMVTIICFSILLSFLGSWLAVGHNLRKR